MGAGRFAPGAGTAKETTSAHARSPGDPQRLAKTRKDSQNGGTHTPREE